MPNGDVETFTQDGTWYNHVTGEPGNIGESYRTMAAAAEAGRQIAVGRRVDHIIKDKKGRISERNSYGDESRNVPV